MAVGLVADAAGQLVLCVVVDSEVSVMAGMGKFQVVGSDYVSRRARASWAVTRGACCIGQLGQNSRSPFWDEQRDVATSMASEYTHRVRGTSSLIPSDVRIQVTLLPNDGNGVQCLGQLRMKGDG